MKLFGYSDNELSVFHSLDETPSPDRFILHAHRNCELYFFISGNGYYTVEGNDYRLSPGCFLAMREGEAHTPHIRPTHPYERIAINFSPFLLPQLEKELNALFFDRPLGKGNIILPQEEAARFLADCMSRMCRDGSDKSHILSYLMPVVLELYYAKTSGAVLGDSPSLFVHPQGSSDTVAHIIEYINANLTTIRNLDDLGQEFFFSKSYINRIFKESTGSSVWDYIVLKRLLLSRTLLQEGKQANIVASECGFSDYSSFYRQFKQRFGISPLAARKNKH